MNIILNKLLRKLLSLKEKTTNNKALLKNYKIKSDRLTQLISAKKDIQKQINEEKDRIEDEMMEDNDYAYAIKTQKELKCETKETNADLREQLQDIEMDQLTTSLEFVIDGEPIKIQVEKTRKFFLNGKEQK